MDANIESIVKDLKKVSIVQVIFEAITNAIHAKANYIEVRLNDLNLSTFDEKEDIQMVDRVSVIDNGDGFNPANIKSFQTYRSPHKKSLGAKGIGRFLYLKLFEKVEINSLLKNIIFTVKKDVEVNEFTGEAQKTHINLLDPKQTYSINKKTLNQQIQEHFLPYFKLLKEDEKKVEIVVFFNDSEAYIISSEDIPSFNTVTFNIKGHDFQLNYLLNEKSTQYSDGFFCAANTVVLKNSDRDSKSKFKMFDGINILFLLSSEYFNENVNDERDGFNKIKAVQVSQDDMYSNLSWENIYEELSTQIKKICLDNDIDINKQADDNLKKSIEKNPFLGSYLSNNDDILSSDELIEKAQKLYESEKVFLRDSKNKHHSLFKVVLDRVVKSELAEYVFDRQKVIEKLKSLTTDQAYEKEIHNLFMPQNTEDSEMNYKSNNLWLFDDRFMTYDKLFSEAEIRKIFPELANNLDRPDILSIVSNTFNKEKITDIVVIELKRPDETITFEGAEAQLLKYSRYINNARKNNKIRVWTYAFLKYSSSINDSFDDQDYNQIPTQSVYPIYYKYFEKRNTIINFMDYRALANDADTRNKTFMNILKGKSFS